MFRMFAAALGLLLAAGCVADQPGRPLSVTSYRCANDTDLRIAWWSDKIDVTYGERRWTMLRVVSASGARFSDGRHEVWEHQGEVRVTPAGEAETVCRRKSQPVEKPGEF